MSPCVLFNWEPNSNSKFKNDKTANERRSKTNRDQKVKIKLVKKRSKFCPGAKLSIHPPQMRMVWVGSVGLAHDAHTNRHPSINHEPCHERERSLVSV